MISRRATTLIVVGVSLFAVLALAMTSLFAAAPTDTWYQCVNASGAIEANRGGVVVPTCANAGDRKITWPVSLYAPAATTSTTTVVTTTAQTPATAAATTTTRAPVTTSTGLTTTSQAPVTTTTGAGASTGIWHPSSASSLTWDWVISASPSTSENVQVMDMDGEANTAAAVAAFHAHGTKVICYIDLGSYEPFRSDLNLIPTADIGNDVQGWPGEKWLNIADVAGLTPLIQHRVNMCASKGFDAVEPDEIDGYSNNSGFPLTAANQITYNKFIAATVHAAGMSVGLKNEVDQASALQPFFDWSLNEECNQYSECDLLAPFTAANKAVFNAEYGSGTAFCAADAAQHINGAKFNLDLAGSGHTACPAW